MAIILSSGYPATATNYSDINAAVDVIMRTWYAFKKIHSVGMSIFETSSGTSALVYHPPVTTASGAYSAGMEQVLQALYGSAYTVGTTLEHVGLLHLMRVELIGMLSALHLVVDQNHPKAATNAAEKVCTDFNPVGSPPVYAHAYAVSVYQTMPFLVGTINSLDTLAYKFKGAHTAHTMMQVRYLDPIYWTVKNGMTIDSMNECNRVLLLDTTTSTYSGALHLARVEFCDALANAYLSYT